MPTKLMVGDDLTPVAAYAALRARSGGSPSFLLESAPTAGERWGRFSVIGWRPRRRVTLDLLAGGAEVLLTVEPLRDGGARSEVRGPSRDALALLRAHTFPAGPPAAPSALRVLDGAVGWVGYDLVHALEPVGPWGETARVAHLLEGSTTVVFDALLQTMTIHGADQQDVDATYAVLSGPRAPLRPLQPPTRGATPAGVETSIDDAAYRAMVTRAKRYIEAGDVFQVVLARKFVAPRGGADPFDAYRALRVLNPSPYLYFLDLGGDGRDEPSAIAGASPETLVRLEDSVVTVRPIAGTRPRGADAESDQALERELLGDPKERAEHVMLVDLGRNDVGRVAKIGTVTVPLQMVVERFSHVMHLVSEVHGVLADDHDAWDALAATFPAGTLSGAPKVRAMQIIRQLEGGAVPAGSPFVRRGLYGGAIGYVSPHRTMDFAIAIRTIAAWSDRFEVGAGAGIVEASDPKLEAEETRHKAGAALSAIAAARQLAEERRGASEA
ncbi:MAG: anthranilate synthase component I family protein [Deltaproteobacteria bacterium]|nr:anthranilate synthase component I family protein [Deltaproteobacteria bacterium]